MIPPPPASNFRLVRYFTVASLSAFLLIAPPWTYLERRGGDCFEQALRQQIPYFNRVQDGRTKQHAAVAAQIVPDAPMRAGTQSFPEPSQTSNHRERAQ